MLTYIIFFLAIAFFPLLLAGYGGHLAAMVLEEKKRRQALRKIWSLAILGVVMAGVQQYIAYKDNKALQARLESIDRTGQNIASDIKFVKSATEIKQLAVPIPSKKANKEPSSIEKEKESKNKESLKNVEKGISELKSLVAGQTWGLNAEQLISLSRQMSPFAKQEDRGDLITCVLGDSDSTKFAVSLVGAFRAAGWQLSGSGLNQAVFSGNPTGIIIKLNSQQSNPPGLPEFVTALRRAGIEPIGEIDTKLPPNHFQIIVGRKP